KRGTVEWSRDPVKGADADRLLAGPGGLEEQQENRTADDLLKELLGNGPLKASEIQKAARDNGIPSRSLARAKYRLGVQSHRVGQPGEAGGYWYWTLPGASAPKDATPPPKSATPTEVASFEKVSARTDETASTSSKDATLQGMASFGTLRAEGAVEPDER